MRESIVSVNEFKTLCVKVCRDITHSNWLPDYIVAVSPNGLILASMMSNYFNVPVNPLTVDLLNGQTESNGWMAEDAIGYLPLEERKDSLYDESCRKNILIVDLVNRTGNTLQWIKNDWACGCFESDPVWATVWNRNVRTAVLLHDENSNFEQVSYTGRNFDSASDEVRYVMPWEKWWLS